MEIIQDEAAIDFARLESTIRNKLIELQLKTKSLEETQQQLAQARQSLYEMERRNEEARRDIALMQSQLDVAMTAMRHWEEEKTLNRCQQVQSNMHSETVLRERDSLLQQTKNLQLENMILQQKIHEFETINANREPLQDTLTQLKNKVLLVVNAANSEFPKLRQELEELQKSLENTNKLNGRLQAAGMCAHGIQQKLKMRIEELENKLDTVSPFQY
ncbi:myomegalin-like [Athalia rosae]|uniref:myomegalin-like n=1 Tax=Athalia rosae TaxID=37344 RepID=UPI0006250720|nr:myomegalin-like [Athalia rosae]